MTCRYTFKGKTYEAHEFDDVLRALSPAEASKYMLTVQDVPDAPFIGRTEAWVSLALKRAIVMAAQNGYDKVAIITGDQAADNFDLSKTVKKVRWNSGTAAHRAVSLDLGDTYIMLDIDKDGAVQAAPDASLATRSQLVGKKLEDIVGKPVAEKIMEGGDLGHGELSGEGLKLGGEGMRAFYDRIVPQVANDVLKKIGGGKVGEVSMAKERFTGGVSGIDAMTGLGIPASQHRTYWAGLEAQERDDMIEAERERRSAALTQPGFDITTEMRERLRNGAPLFSKAREQEETPEFKAWFGDSQVVDASGKPLVVYHGTNADFSEFEPAGMNESRHPSALLGNFFTTSPKVAEEFTYAEDASIIPAYLKMVKPFTMTWGEFRRKFVPKDSQYQEPGDVMWERIADKAEDLTASLAADGYDGIHVIGHKNSIDPEGKADNWIVFDPKQIKSAIGNSGDFDPRHADITRSKYRDLDLANGYKVADLLDSSKTVSWWDNTVGTPYRLAEKHPQFKRVYDAVQRFISDVSKYATRAADLAPNILPKLENLKDVFKSPLSAADVAALADPIFKGTLSYARDDQGKPVLTSDVGAAGVVWRDDELKSMWKLDDRQIGLYREFRRATNKSISDMATTHMVRYVGKDGDAVRDQVLAAPTVKAAYQILADHLAQLALATPGRADSLQNTVKTLKDTANMAQGLIAKGYAPLSRFGDYTVYVTRDGGKEQVFFGMYETEREANRAAREFKNDPKFADATIATGTMSKEASKLFKGITPETLALFGEALGLEESASDQESQVFQEYLKLAKANRSAMKHMIERKGIAGYSEDAGRVLASFVYSNARQSSTNLNAGEMIKSASEVQQGDLKDQAIRLVDYVQNPQEEAQTIRGMLFAQYIGGSIASALVNTTQSITTTWPTLSMYFGVGKAGKAMASALPIVKNGAGNDTELAAAMKRAEEEGVTAPQETHQLMAQAAGRGQLRSGDGTLIGDTLAKAKNSLAKVQMVWGKGFGFAELLNRQIAFVSAFNLAREKGMEDPYSFAKKIVAETQYVMNKGNNPSWARGPVGATLFTFRKFMINYLEGLARMWGGGPEGKKAFALSLAIMFMMAGVGGFPFADDLDDIIDGFAQRVLNKSFSSKLEKKQFFAKILGDAGADFVLSGISGLPGVPVDFSGRLGLGNIAPGTGLFVKKQDHTRDVKDIAGAGGDFINRMVTATGALAQGDMRAAFQNVVPIAIGNALKAKQMAELGVYQDFKGRRVIDVTKTEAMLKAIGFQPQSVKQIQEATTIQQGLIAVNKIRETEIADLWARGRIERKPDLVEDAQRQLREWNEANKYSPISIDQSQINKRVREANMTKAQRLARTAPKEIRKDVKEALEKP